MGMCTGIAGSAGALRGDCRTASPAAPRPAPRITVHKNSSLQSGRDAASRDFTGLSRALRRSKRPENPGKEEPPADAKAWPSHLQHDLGHHYWQIAAARH